MWEFDHPGCPIIVDDPREWFADEREFEVFLMRQGYWFWRQLGVKTPKRNPLGHSPDLITRINQRGDSSPRFGIEVEYWASNFRTHKHDTYNTHLVIACTAQLVQPSVRGVPVLAFYRKCPGGHFHYSLEDDIGSVFHGGRKRLPMLYA